jgi:hypothetical protein
MRAGLLRERIVVKVVVKVETSQTIEVRYEVLRDNVPARAVCIQGRLAGKGVEADEVYTEMRVEFHVRYYYKDILKSNMLITWKGEDYEITGIAPRLETQEVVITGRKLIENE